MSAPLDPRNPPDGPSEFSWGLGIFPPGIASNLGQENIQDDFGANYSSQGLSAKESGGYENPVTGSGPDGYAIMTADKRTDLLDPDATTDFETLGNMDRYGAGPRLVREMPMPNIPWYEEFEIIPLETPRGP